MRVGREVPRAIAGAVLIDLAVSPLFAWDVLAGAFARRLAAGEASLTLVFSIGLVCFTAGVLAGGRAADRIAPRRLAVVTATGAVAGLLGAGVARSLPELIAAFGVVLGAATGLGYATAVRVGGTLAARRGATLGLVVSAYAAGTIVIAPVAAVLLNATTVFETLAVLAGAVGAVVLLAAALLPGKPAGPALPAVPGKPSTARRPRAFPISAGVVGLWAVFGLGAAPALTAFAHAGQIAGYPHAAVLAVPLLSAGSLAGRLVAGAVSDRVGRRAALRANAAVLAADCAVLAISPGAGVRLAALLVLGAQYGALSALVPAATADIVPAQRFGACYGMVFTGWGLAGLVVPVAAAALAAEGGWDSVFAALAGFAVLAWLVIAMTRRRAPNRGFRRASRGDS